MKESNPLEGRIRSPLVRLCNRLIDRLFADEDANALAHGWEVRRRPGGGRSYRDPRWDSVRCCEFCDGTGIDTAGSTGCQPCDGTGVIRSVPTRTDPAATEVRR